MKIEKVQEAYIPKNPFVSGSNNAPVAPIGNDNKIDRVSKNENIEKLNSLAKHIITEANALIIEKNPNGSGFIYKSIDRLTGEIVRIWPREEVIGMLEATFSNSSNGTRVNKIA